MDPEANIIFGAVIDDALGDEVRVTVIAAGFDGGEPKVRDASQPALLRENGAVPAAPSEEKPPAKASEYLKPDPHLDGPLEPVEVEYDDDLDIPDFLR